MRIERKPFKTGKTTIMKITGLRIHSIAIADPPLRSSYGLHAPYALRTIIELESDDGIIGINETYGGEIPAAALLQIKHKLIGADPFRITGTLNPQMKHGRNGQDGSQTYLVPGENPLDETSRTYAAIEVACLDLNMPAEAAREMTFVRMNTGKRCYPKE